MFAHACVTLCAAVQMNAGLRFILTAPNVIGVVRSTVALMFIQVCLKVINVIIIKVWSI